MLKLNRGDQAKQCFMEALALDVKCYDAFDQLVTGEMMTPDEGCLIFSACEDPLTPFSLCPEWEFVQGLAYASQTPQDAHFVQLIYTARLRKYKHTTEHALTRQRLVEEYNLGDNPDVLFSFADALYSNFRWADCFTITSRCGFIPLAVLSNLTPMIEFLVLFPFTTKPCPCILHACTIFLICILNSLF